MDLCYKDSASCWILTGGVRKMVKVDKPTLRTFYNVSNPNPKDRTIMNEVPLNSSPVNIVILSIKFRHEFWKNINM